MRKFPWATMLAAGFLLIQSAGLFLPSPRAGEDWRAEFEAVCGITDSAMTLKKEELKILIERCDKMKSSIDAEEETVRKVYLRRLKSCRDLYAYVLESKIKE